MWHKTWNYSEGAVIGAGLLVIGSLLQVTVGSIDWQMLSSPLNLFLLLGYVLALCISYILRKQLYVVRWSMTLHAAVPALLCGVLVTLCLGLSGWEETLRAWPFVLIYVWLMNITCLVGIDRTVRLISAMRKRLPWRVSLLHLSSALNHLGLFIAMVCGTLGFADMQRLHMTLKVGIPEWRAVDADHAGRAPIELPFAIELRSFSIDEYAPQYSIIDNETGNVVQDSHWQVRQDSLLDYATPWPESDGYVEWHCMGACTAAHITVTNGNEIRQGWISCGSFMFPYKVLQLDEQYSAVMLQREPKRYVSEVTAFTEQGEKTEAAIEVNHPLEIAGWKIYQLSYDEALGRWSDTSVFELVRDPWLPLVYTGIFMMLAGAALLFLTNNQYNNKEQD